MTETYALWDRESGNIIGSYASENDALATVRGLLKSNGSAIAQDLLLAREDDAGIPSSIASGSDLGLKALLAQAALLTGSQAVTTTSTFTFNISDPQAWTGSISFQAEVEPEEVQPTPTENTDDEGPGPGNRQSTLATAA